MSMQIVEGPEVVKVATVPLARQRLRREASALRRAAHPGVAQLALFVDLAERTELRLRHAGDRDLVTMPPPDGPAALALGASLASTVADLHAVGVVHGRLTPDHVVVDPTGRAVLCGLSGAHDASEAAIAEEVRSLATLLEVLATAVPQPGARRDRRAVATLLAVAESARTADPPTANDIAAQLGERARSRRGVASLPGRVDKRTLAGATVAVVALVGFAAAWAARGDSSALGPVLGSPSRAPSDPSSAATVVEATATTVPTEASNAAAATAPASATAATTAPPGPAAAVEFSSGGARYAVGADGDVVVTGDWDCDGTIGAALLRPGTGAVYAFDRLAGAGEAVPGRLVAEATTAVGLDVVPQPDGCDVLLLRGADGGAEVLAVTP